MGTPEPQRRIDPQQALRLGTAAGHLPLHFLDFTQYSAGIHQVGLAFGGEADAARGAVEQAHTQALFQLRQTF